MDKVVYIINDGGHDYTDAKRFGELRFCTIGSVDKFDIAQMYRTCSRALDDSQPEDLLLLTSLSSLCSVASAIFANKHGRLNLLLFRDGQYTERSIQLIETIGY